MESTSSSRRPSAEGRRRSIVFATIDEEPIERSVATSQRSGYSITLEDLDPRELQRDRSSLELPPDDDLRALASSVDPNESRLRSSQTGVVSALRRFRRSKFGSQDDNNMINQGEGPPPPPMTMASFVNRDDRRATIFARTDRRSSQTSSASGTQRRLNSLLAAQASSSNIDTNTYCFSDATIHVMRSTIDHSAWRGMTLLFILVLLFGPPIQDLWMPKTADAAMDGIFTVCFVVLAIDITTRSIVDKSYFAWKWNRREEGKCCHKIPVIQIGSFMFWFDTVALLTTLFRISYINPLMTQPVHDDVVLDGLGFPIGGAHSTPITMEWSLMFTVGRVGLMARFIRTSVLVKMTFHWIRYLYPAYWISKMCRRLRRRRENQEMNSISQRVLASSSRGRARDSRNSDPFLVSGLGNSQVSQLGHSRGSRRSSRSSKLLQVLGTPEPLSDEPPEPPEDDCKRTPLKTFFKLFSKGEEPDVQEPELDGTMRTSRTNDSIFFSNSDAKDSRSHVGAAMRELTGQRIATGALLALLLSVICTWSEDDTTNVMTMLLLHGQTANPNFANMSLNVARSSVIPTLFHYTRADETDVIFSETYELSPGWDVNDLRAREIYSVNVTHEGSDVYTSGQFDNSQVTMDWAKVELVTTIIILCVWVLGVASFAGPVMTLVVEPIERMVRLLSMLMKDPLGYQKTPQYRTWKKEGEESAEKSLWPKDVLKGMETNFLIQNILRIGNLMRVGFGMAGAEIIRSALERGRHKDVLFLSKQGSSVSCIFLFCDIRQFTDATECLKEEVFVFTNKIAAVVHSICHSYGGSANKNIGDAFLLSWLLDEAPIEEEKVEYDDPFLSQRSLGNTDLTAKHNQADKALLSVVKISMALHYDNFFVEGMDEAAKNRLLAKLSKDKRKGPIVQMGFGLHAGKAVQGAIGSQRKLDATYISESVERAEFLESSTKTYGVPLLMSDAFYDLLSSSNRLRCRKVDQLLLLTEQDGDLSDPHEILDSGEKMNIYTFDMDIDALWKPSGVEEELILTTANSDNDARRFGSSSSARRRSRRLSLSSPPTSLPSRSDIRGSAFSKNSERQSTASREYQPRRSSFSKGSLADQRQSSGTRASRRSSLIPSFKTASFRDVEKAMHAFEDEQEEKPVAPRQLILPTEVRHYNERDWHDADIKKIRHVYVSSGIIFPKYQEGLKSYYAKDWAQAKKCFEFVLSQRDDNPSHYFLQRMAEHGGVPPSSFIPYTVIRE